MTTELYRHWNDLVMKPLDEAARRVLQKGWDPLRCCVVQKGFKKTLCVDFASKGEDWTGTPVFEVELVIPDLSNEESFEVREKWLVEEVPSPS